MFEHTIQLWNERRRLVETDEAAELLWAEGSTLLRRMRHLVDRLEGWIRRTEDPDPRAPFPGVDDWEDLLVWSEAFYSAAWRLQQLTLDKRLEVPPVRARGVTFVRNQLIAHPVAPQTQSMVVTSDGPVLRFDGGVSFSASTGRAAAVDAADKGLFVNARALEHLLDEALTNS